MGRGGEGSSSQLSAISLQSGRAGETGGAVLILDEWVGDWREAKGPLAKRAFADTYLAFDAQTKLDE